MIYSDFTICEISSLYNIFQTYIRMLYRPLKSREMIPLIFAWIRKKSKILGLLNIKNIIIVLKLTRKWVYHQEIGKGFFGGFPTTWRKSCQTDGGLLLLLCWKRLSFHFFFIIFFRRSVSCITQGHFCNTFHNV